MIKYIFGIILIAIFFLFKPITSHFIEKYASEFLEQKVKVTFISILALRADAYIAESNNTISANILSISPLKIRAYYSGDIDAFKKYQPLKGHAEADAIIIYNDKLLVNGEASLYGAKAKVTVKQLKEKWYVGVDATSLNLKTLQEQNNKEVKADAVVDFNLNLYTDANTSINLQTKSINISGTHINEVDIKLLHEKENFKLITSFKPPNFYKISVDSNGTFKDYEILASTNIAFKNTKMLIDKIEINTKTLQTSLHTSSFGGNLDATYKKDRLNWDAKELHLSKVLKAAEQKPLARGYLNLRGELDIKTLDANLFFSSPWIVASKQRVEEIKLNIPNLKYENKELSTSYELSTLFMKKLFNFNGDIHFKDILKLDAKNKSFGGKTELHLEDKKFEISMKKLDLKELQEFAFIKPLVLGLIDLEANGDFENIDFKVSSDELHSNIKLEDMNNSLSLNLSGNYTPKLLSIKDNLILHYKKEHIPLKLDFKIEPFAPYKSRGFFTHKQDKFVVHSFSYENEQVESDFFFDIQDLYQYRALMANTFHGPMKIEAKYTDSLNIITKSLGGEVKVNLNKSDISAQLKEVDITKVAKLIAKDGILEHGTLNGDATYNIKEKRAKTDLALTSALLNGVNIDEKISTLNDAMGLNVINMAKSIITDFSDVNKSKTNIKHLQFNVSLKDKKIKIEDVALSTNKFLIVALGELEQNGNINSLDVSIVDINGCAIITQALSGNIKDPKTAQTTSTIVNIVENVPSAILDTGRKIINFSAQTIDDVASFGAQQVLRTDKKISVTSDIISESSSLIKFTSNIIMPQGCNVIYNGKVENPIKLRIAK